MKLMSRLILLIGILAAGTVLDQGTKILAKQKLSGGQTYSYFFDSFRLQYSENRGAFLSMFDNIPDPMGSILLAFVPSVILILLLIYMIMSKKMTPLYFTALALIFTCGVNNVFGRIVNHRMVVDFMSFSIGPFFRFTGILNFADMYGTAGVIILFLTAVFERKAHTPPKAAGGGF